MPRIKQFDPNDILSKAVEIFWQKGYSNTSLANLVEHLGINRFSLYSTFGDKRNLYLQSLNYYIEHNSLPSLKKLTEEGTELDDLKNYFQYFSQLQYKQTSGCFVQNAILELSLSDADVGEIGQKLYQLVQEAFYSVLKTAHSNGQLRDDADLECISHFLLLQSQGIRVLGKAKQYKIMDDAVKIIYQYIDGLEKKI